LLGYVDGDAAAAFDHAVTTAYSWTAEDLGTLLAPLGLRVVEAEARQDPGARRRHGHLVAVLADDAIR
jgi:hypothetical protein